MGDFGLAELMIVAVIAIIVVGPKDLPKVLRSVMNTIRKVREMGAEFQAGVKKMADEVELDAVTRKLNEAGRAATEEPTPSTKPAKDYTDYSEYDYDGHDEDDGPFVPTPSTDKNTSSDDAENASADETDGASKTTAVEEPAKSSNSDAVDTPKDDKVKNKADD